ncbi:MAG: PIN domain-containing protein [Casimicrobiaceae bacterium]
MSGWLLDTNVTSELRRPRPSARVRSFIMGRRLEDLFVSTVTFAEIRFGIEGVGDPIRRAEPNDWLLHRRRAGNLQADDQLIAETTPEGPAAAPVTHQFGALYGRTVRGVIIHSPRSLAEALLL